MKKLNLFSDLWSLIAGSQRNEVEFDRRLTVGSLSGFTINWTLKLVSALAILLTVGVSNAWGAVGDAINSHTNIADATVYYLAGQATVSKKTSTYYSLLASDEAGDAITGNATTTRASGTKYTFLIENSKYYLVTPNGLYVEPGSSNGKLILTAAAKAVTVSTVSSKIRITGTTYTDKSIQKNKTTAANFGSYGNTQNDLTLYIAGYRVIYDKNGATGGTVPNDATVYGDNATATIKANTGTLVKAGYTFAGWNTAANGSGTDVAASGSATRTITAGLRLYAKWTVAASCDNVPTVTAGSLKGSVTSSSSATAQCTGGITNIGGAGCSLTSYGFAVGTSSNPTIGGTLTGTGKTYEVGSSIAASTGFEKLIDGLSASTTYYVRPYATNGADTGYGTQFSFTTLAACTTAPTVTAGSKGTITSTTAAVTCASGLSSLGTGGCAISSYGFVYGTSSNPTTSNSTTEVGTSIAASTSFNTTLTGLTEGTLYYVRPYATNGYGTGYGTQVSFGTPKITVSQSSRAFGDRAVGGSYTMTFTVSGTYLQSNIGIARTSGSTYFTVDKATVTQTDGTASATTITVTYAPTAAGSHSATLTLTSTNATSKTVSLSGTGKWTVTFLNGNGGTHSTALVANSTAPSKPGSNPAACDATSTTFIGWTQSAWSDKQNQSFIDGRTAANVKVYTSSDNLPAMTSDVTYYPVYAKAGESSTTFKRVQTTDDLAGATKIAIINAYSSSNYILTTDLAAAQSAPTESTGKISVSSGQYWTLEASSTNWKFKTGNNYLVADGAPGSSNSEKKKTISVQSSGNTTWAITSNSHTGNGTPVFTVRNTVNDYAGLEYSSGWCVYYGTNFNTSWYTMKLYVPDAVYSDYLTTCCTSSAITLASSGSVTGGTFSADPTSACENASVTLSATPSSKEYVFDAWTVTKTESPYTDITSTNVAGNTLTMPDFAVTVSASFSAISSIAVKTAPTKTTYCAGENFDPTGLVVTATYENSTTQDISYASDAALFTFSPATNAALATNNSSVSITVYNKSTSQAITVNASHTIGLTGSGTVTGGTFEADNSSACAGATITLTPHNAEHYSFTSWTITKAGGGTVTPIGNTFTMPDENVTVNATFTEDTYHYATFKNDLTAVSGYDHVKVYDGTKPTPPTLTDVTDACDKTDCNKFYGWIAEADIWEETINSVGGKTIYRNASDIPNVSGADVVYHAVWAKGTGSPNIPNTLIAKWDQQSITASTAIKATDKDGNTLNSVTMTSNISMTTSAVYGYANTSISSDPVITLAGLDFSDYNAGVITFFARGSQQALVTVEYSTDGGSSYSTDHFSDGTAKKEYGYVVTVPNTTTNVKISYGSNTGNFYFGSVRAYGTQTTSYDFTELTSSNTSGWSGADWDGYYLIVGNSKTKALRSDIMEGLYGMTTVSPSEGVISTSDLGLMFKVKYNSSTSKYAIRSAATQDYLTDNAGGFSEVYHLLETSATEANAIAYNDITHTTGYYVRWNSDRFGSYGSCTAPTLYKIMGSFTEFRVTCCEKYDINLSSSGSVEGGTFSTTPESACEGQEVTLNLLTTNSGYNISSWTVTGTVSGDEVSVTGSGDGATFTMPDEAVTVTAVFATAHTTTVTLNKQSGTGGTNSVTATVNLPMPAATMPTNTGYTFGGYYSAINGSGTQYYDAEGNSSHVWDDSESDAATLYAKWTSSGYTVTLNTEGGSGGTTSVTVHYGANTNLTSAITCPTKANNVFGGYFTSAGGAGTQLIDADGNWLPSVTSYTDVTKQWLYANDLELHAKWTSVSYTNYRTTCGPEIELAGGPIYLTSYANCEVLTPSTALITVSSDAWGSTVGAPKFLKFTLKDKIGGTTYSHTSSNIASSEFRVYNADGNGSSYADGSYFAIPTGTTGEATYNFRIAYKPAASVYNTLDHYVLEVEVMDNSTPTKKAITMETMDLYGRTLPEQFVIAVKKDGQWYALPNDLASTAETAKATAAIPIVVDNATTPTSAVFAPENVLYKGTQYYDGPAVANRNRSGIRFTRSGSQYLQVSTTPANNNMWLSSTGGTDVQDWYLNSSTFGAYEVKIDPRVGSGGYKDKKIGMYGSNFGFYSSPTASDIYFLPVIGVLEEASVTEWGKNSVILEVDARNYSKVIARVGDVATGALAYSQTQTSGGGASIYNYTINFGNAIDLTTKKDQILYFDWLNAGGDVAGTSMVSIPWLIDGTKTMSVIDAAKTHWEKAEVHVLPNAVLTADAATFSGVTIKQLEIYPGATVKVTTGTLTPTTLVLRNGWSRVGGKRYDVARLHIANDANMAKPSNIYADWYIDFDQYYPIAVPWEVGLGSNDGSKIKYLNTNSAAIIGEGSGTSLRLRYYDGESRANNGQTGVGSGTNWKLYGSTGNRAIPAKLEPGKGYAMTAKRPSGKAFSIIRMPLNIPSADWITSGEKGYISPTHKDTVYVNAWGSNANPAKPTYLVGWNFVANPYMSLYSGTIEYDDETKVAHVSIPDIDFKEYDQVATATAKLKPGSGFLIQAPKDGSITFGSAKRAAAAPSYRNTVKEEVPEQQAYILLSQGATEDMMGIFVSKKYTAAYELNADLEKLLSDGNTLRTYMRYGDMNMAYVAINEELAKEWIPVMVRIPANGEYTFKMHEASVADELEGVYLIDYETGITTNLLYDDYTFYCSEGTRSNRFAINAVVGVHKTPTGLDISDTDKDGPTKFIYHDKVYILHNNVIYDSTGKRVNVINK
ncbi:MAG: InlB B-repeat-containing protein [Paludibacteraceae bacterium]|nr:InlB B-repeat-containing protein [Paludibacteraceae bacterium]